MHRIFRPSIAVSVWILSALIALSPNSLWACGCGCGVFDVQTSAMLPTQTSAMIPREAGGTAYLEYDFLNQNRDWNGSSRGSDDANGDKQLRTHFVTAGAQYMFNSRWGIAGEVPVWNRYFQNTDGDGNIVTHNHTALGDIRLRGVYSGFRPDMSTGVTFGAKLPTGDYTSPGFDRDSEIGSGSTDLLLGAYHLGSLSDDNRWGWFAHIQWDQPVLITAGFRPGAEIDALAGAYYEGWKLAGLRVAPLAEIIESLRMRDSGTFANSPNSGYGRILAAPGLEIDAARWRFNGSVGFPVAEYVNGDQLTAPFYFKFSTGYAF